jgi:hypothetical protein
VRPEGVRRLRGRSFHACGVVLVVVEFEDQNQTSVPRGRDLDRPVCSRLTQRLEDKGQDGDLVYFGHLCNYGRVLASVCVCVLRRLIRSNLSMMVAIDRRCCRCGWSEYLVSTKPVASS